MDIIYIGAGIGFLISLVLQVACQPRPPARGRRRNV